MRRRAALLLTAMVAALVLATGVALAVSPPNNDTTTAPKDTTTQQQGATTQEATTTPSFKRRHIPPLKTFHAWGDNDIGELGTGSYVPDESDTPVLVSDVLHGADVKSISGGDLHSLALKNDGTVWAWGDNVYGQLGNGTNDTDSATPVQVVDSSDPSGYLQGVTAISAGTYHNLALKSDGTVRAWGDNTYGQLGNGTSGTEMKSKTPMTVSNLTDVKSVSGGAEHSLALENDGTIKAWGGNESGQLGYGTTTNTGCKCSPAPVTVSALSSVKEVAAGGYHNLALNSDATVSAWGSNNSGQLGNGTTSNDGGCTCIATPGSVSGLTGVIGISAGRFHSLALQQQSRPHSKKSFAYNIVKAWGYNGDGELGNGTSGEGTDSNLPVQVSGLTGGVTDISSGSSSFHSLARKNDGTVRAWGRNNRGQLGNGTSGSTSLSNENSNIPVKVSNLSGVTSIAAGEDFSLATRSS
jgi:alpha-tubulin suppressor-like RCC1 family protein